MLKDVEQILYWFIVRGMWNSGLYYWCSQLQVTLKKFAQLTQQISLRLHFFLNISWLYFH